MDQRGAPASRATDLDDQRFRDVFIGILSHELRTPLTSIYGGAQLLAGDRITPVARITVAEDIASEAERLHRMVEDLLAMARVERGATAPAEEPILVQHLARDAVAAERRAWPGRQIELRVFADLPPARGDGGLTVQILRNLIGHVIRHESMATTIAVVATAVGDEIRVEVVDAGPGPSPDLDRDAFRLFYRDGRGAMHPGGTGIDLYVARVLAEAQGGRVWSRPHTPTGTELGLGLQAYDPEAGA